MIHRYVFQFCVYPVNMPVGASTGPVLARCRQHRPSTGSVLACLQGSNIIIEAIFYIEKHDD